MPDLTICATGHRLKWLGGYHPKIYSRLRQVATQALTDLSPARVITGMALGWDQAIAKACIELGIPFEAAIPFQGQESRWPATSQDDYWEILTHADDIHVLSDSSYSPSLMEARNRWMVDHSDEVVALWNKLQSGGTWNCIQYAFSKGKPVINYWPEWKLTDA